MGHIVLSNGSSDNRLFKKPAEHKTTVSRIASVERERKVLQVGLQVVRMETPPLGVLPFGDAIVVWRGNNMRIVDPGGATLWDVDFARQLAAVDVFGEELVCVAGAVMVFGRAVVQDSMAPAVRRLWWDGEDTAAVRPAWTRPNGMESMCTGHACV